MPEEKTIAEQLKRARIVAMALATVAILAIMYAIYANAQREHAERNTELVEQLKKLELDSCAARNTELSQYLQETLYTLEYEKKKNQSK